MKNIIVYIISTTLLASCKAQQFDIASMSGRYVGVDRAKNTLSTSIRLELNKDSTCLFERSMDLSKNICQGKWGIVNNCVINITYDYPQFALLLYNLCSNVGLYETAAITNRSNILSPKYLRLNL